MSWSRETTESYLELGPQRHLPVVRRAIAEMLGDLEGCRVLDFGCGSARLSAVLAMAGAAEIIAVDESPEMIEAAEAFIAAGGPRLREHITLRLGDETALEQLGVFDAALCSLALMMCSTRQRLESTCRALVRCLRPGGLLLAVITHPCFRRRAYRTFHYDLPDDFRYWLSGEPFQVVLTPPNGHHEITITDFHWTLEDVVNALVEEDAGVTRIRELPARWQEDGAPASPPAYLALRIERCSDEG